MKNANIAFFGTPELSVKVLNILEAEGIVPGVIVCAPDKPVGREQEVTPPPTKVWADARGIPTLQPSSLSKEPPDELVNTEWDLFIVFAYGQIIPQAILDLPKKGAINLHPSLLPRFRGPSPIRSAILADERVTGVSVMLMDSEVDHGPIIAQGQIAIDPWPQPGRIVDDILVTEGAHLLAEAIPLWLAGEITPEEQLHTEATFTKKIVKADGEISLTEDPYQLWLKYCAYDEWPGIWFTQDAKRIKITQASYENGVFTILSVIPESKGEVDWETFSKK